jgi:hypothetical protein
MAAPKPNVRYVVRYTDKRGKAQVYDRTVFMPTDGTVAITFPKDCPWPPEKWRQVVVEFSPPVTGSKDG